mgnify:CR=1 FL=1
MEFYLDVIFNGLSTWVYLHMFYRKMDISVDLTTNDAINVYMHIIQNEMVWNRIVTDLRAKRARLVYFFSSASMIFYPLLSIEINADNQNWPF